MRTDGWKDRKVVGLTDGCTDYDKTISLRLRRWIKRGMVHNIRGNRYHCPYQCMPIYHEGGGGGEYGLEMGIVTRECFAK